MKTQIVLLTLTWLVLTTPNRLDAQDWPQWRGPNRDGKAAGFNVPTTWPQELIQKWKVTVGDGVATPALVGDRLYVFTREDGNEILRCLNAETGQEVWQDKYPSLGAEGPARSYSGPRCSPAVANGRVVTVGVRGMVSCLDAATGNLLWRKDEFKSWPRFFTSASPMIIGDLCIAQLGGGENGAVVAYDLETGSEKWKWSGGSPTYSSPVLMNLGDKRLVVARTDSNLVAVDATNGALVWQDTPAAQAEGRGRGGRRGGGRDYKAATAIINGQTIITAGQGTKAVSLQVNGAAKELWKNTESSIQFNTPVLKNGYLFGLTPANEVFCVNAQNGQTAWTAPLTSAQAQESRGGDREGRGRGRGGRGGRGGGRGGYGSVVDGGSVLMALTPSSELIAFEPSPSNYSELARIKVAETPTHAHPVVSGNRVFIKDQGSVALLTFD